MKNEVIFIDSESLGGVKKQKLEININIFIFYQIMN